MSEHSVKELPVSELSVRELSPGDPTPRTLVAVLYPGFELLDLYGPLEMFGTLTQDYRIVTVAQQAGPVASTQGPATVADYDFDTVPACNLLLLPGGIGTLPALSNAALLDYLRRASAQAEVTMSVCSGSAILARAGLLDGLRATSNKQFFQLAQAQSSAVQWVTTARWVDAGRFVTSSGVSAGTDMALAVIARLQGVAVAEGVAAGAEYQWHRDADVDPFVVYLNAAMSGLPPEMYTP